MRQLACDTINVATKFKPLSLKFCICEACRVWRKQRIAVVPVAADQMMAIQKNNYYRYWYFEKVKQKDKDSEVVVVV
ncbi:unnamed protein product [Prunus armeniaca]|uniref:Uncharacterized protein n=1 Tax=Prunus armeniaca TaxID=36596 RepID=A0A6J5U5B7_PRUAR|nr:unnamed protein product [Prunus armeniaca]